MRVYYTTEVLEATAADLGAEIHFQPDTYKPGGFVTFPSGQRAFFLNNQLGANGFGASSVANDKHVATSLMRHFGYRVPEEVLLEWNSSNLESTVEEGLAFAHSIGFPVVVKPRNMSQGHLVSKVSCDADFISVVRGLFELRHHALVQKFHPGDDHRIVVLDGEIIVAYVRKPPAITGDGVSTIRELTDSYLARLSKEGRSVRLNLDDVRVRSVISSQGMVPGSILPFGQTLRLLDTANMSSGATGTDLTAQLHPNYAELCIRLSRDLGLRLCGVDLLAADVTAPVGDHVVLEVNASPGIRHFAALGKAQDLKARALYRRILAGLVEG